MIIDSLLVMSDAQAVTVSAASTSHIDSLAAGDAVAPGARLQVLVNTAFVTGDAATLTVKLECDGDSAFGSVKTLFTSEAFAAASLTAGAVLVDIQIPPKLVERYIRAYYTVGVGSFSAGKVDARIVLDTAKTMDKQL